MLSEWFSGLGVVIFVGKVVFSMVLVLLIWCFSEVVMWLIDLISSWLDRLFMVLCLVC